MIRLYGLIGSLIKLSRPKAFWSDHLQTMVQTLLRSNFRPDPVILAWEHTGVRSTGSDHKKIGVWTSTWVLRYFPTQVEVEIELWSDAIERRPLCSQTKTTGSGKQFEGKIVWAMVWFRSDQRSIRPGMSDQRRIWAHLSLIRGRIDCTWVWSEAVLIALESVQRPYRVHLSLNFF